MTRINLLLMLAVVVSALLLVRSQYNSRQLFTEIDKAQSQARQLEIDNERLQVAKRAQTTPSRIEKIAKDQLQMRNPTPAITQYVTYKAATAP